MKKKKHSLILTNKKKNLDNIIRNILKSSWRIKSWKESFNFNKDCSISLL